MRPGWEPWIQKNKNTNSKKLNLVKVFSKEEKNGMGQGRNLKLRTTLKNNTSANHDSLISGMVREVPWAARSSNQSLISGMVREVPWAARSSSQSILKEINSEYLLEEQLLKL